MLVVGIGIWRFPTSTNPPAAVGGTAVELPLPRLQLTDAETAGAAAVLLTRTTLEVSTPAPATLRPILKRSLVMDAVADAAAPATHGAIALPTEYDPQALPAIGLEPPAALVTATPLTLTNPSDEYGPATCSCDVPAGVWVRSPRIPGHGKLVPPGRIVNPPSVPRTALAAPRP